MEDKFDLNATSTSDGMSQLCGQDGRAVQGAAFRSQSGLPGVGSNPTSDNNYAFSCRSGPQKALIPLGFEPRTSGVITTTLRNHTFASAGNRTRAARVAGEHSTTEPPMLHA